MAFGFLRGSRNHRESRAARFNEEAAARAKTTDLQSLGQEQNRYANIGTEAQGLAERNRAGNTGPQVNSVGSEAGAYGRALKRVSKGKMKILSDRLGLPDVG